MSDDRATDELASFLAQRGDHLMRSAVLLAGGRQAGEDLLQTAVERLLVRWRRFDGDPERYLRKIMANLATDDHRRRSAWRRKARLLQVAEQPGIDPTAEIDLASRVRRRRGQRRTRTLTASGAAAVAIAAITVAAVSAGTARQASRGALPPATPSAAPSDIEYLRLVPAGKYNSSMTWVYGQRSRQRIVSWTGQPVEDDSITVLSFKHGVAREIRSIVEYASKTWASGTVTTDVALAPPNHACEHPAFSWPDTPQALPGWIRRLRYLVGCGELAVAGTGRIDGTKVIKVVQIGPTLTPGLWETIWVKRGSYVPVRVAGGNGTFSWRADISWLRPVKANLALLTAPVPAGFRRTSLSDFPNAIIPITIATCRPEPSNPKARICGTPR